MRGGKRSGAGRPKGAATKRSREIADQAIAEGTSPLEYMLGVMRDPEAAPARRDEMAKMAAPYIHPRVSAVQIADEPLPTHPATVVILPHNGRDEILAHYDGFAELELNRARRR